MRQPVKFSSPQEIEVKAAGGGTGVLLGNVIIRTYETSSSSRCGLPLAGLALSTLTRIWGQAANLIYGHRSRHRPHSTNFEVIEGKCRLAEFSCASIPDRSPVTASRIASSEQEPANLSDMQCTLPGSGWSASRQQKLVSDLIRHTEKLTTRSGRPRRRTVLDDAIFACRDRLTQTAPSRYCAIVIVSDGDDNHSEHDQALETAQRPRR